ncbi:hypothetical protein NKG94_05975 [Micromonospora sp. M12]
MSEATSYIRRCCPGQVDGAGDLDDVGPRPGDVVQELGGGGGGDGGSAGPAGGAGLAERGDAGEAVGGPATAAVSGPADAAVGWPGQPGWREQDDGEADGGG